MAYNKKILAIISNGTAFSWQHINFHGEYESNEPQKSSFTKLDLEQILDMKIDAKINISNLLKVS